MLKSLTIDKIRWRFHKLVRLEARSKTKQCGIVDKTRRWALVSLVTKRTLSHGYDLRDTTRNGVSLASCIEMADVFD